MFIVYSKFNKISGKWLVTKHWAVLTFDYTNGHHQFKNRFPELHLDALDTVSTLVVENRPRNSPVPVECSLEYKNNSALITKTIIILCEIFSSDVW